jgi:hypothetical protein
MHGAMTARAGVSNNDDVLTSWRPVQEQRRLRHHARMHAGEVGTV